jgi:hypothetical protein
MSIRGGWDLSSDFDVRLDEILTGLVGDESAEDGEDGGDAEEVVVAENEEVGTEPALEDELSDDVGVADEDDLEEDDESSDEDEEEPDAVDLDPEMSVRIDGKVVKVKDALELKADYTRKTQALAEERKAFEVEKAEADGRLGYLAEMETVWQEEPAHLLATFAAATDDAEDVLAETVVALASSGAADGNLAVVKALIALASNDLLSEDLAEQIGFTDEVIARIKRQAKSEHRVVKMERRLAAEDRKRSEEKEVTQAAEHFEAEVNRHLSELNSQWERVISGNPEVAAMSASERQQLRVALVTYAKDNDGVPLTVAFDAMEARRLRGESAKRAATAATKQKKASGSRVVSKPSTSGATPAKREKGDWDSAIAEAMAELEARKRSK